VGRKCLARWASGLNFVTLRPLTEIPVHSSQEAADVAPDQKYLIDLQEDGHPRFPTFDIDLVTPSDARLMLKLYIELTWSKLKQRYCLTHHDNFNVQSLSSSRFKNWIWTLFLGTY